MLHLTLCSGPLWDKSGWDDAFGAEAWFERKTAARGRWTKLRPIFRSSDFVRNSGMPAPTASRMLRVSRDNETLTVLSAARGRRPALLAFAKLLRVAEGNK